MARKDVLVTMLSLGMIAMLTLAAIAAQCTVSSEVSEDLEDTIDCVGTLVSTMTHLIHETKLPGVFIDFDDRDWIILPAEKAIVGRVELDRETVESFVETFGEVVDRVGDLMLEALGDWSIGVVIEDYAYTYHANITLGYLQTTVSEDGTTLGTSVLESTIEERAGAVAQSLNLLEQTLNTLNPSGKGEVVVTRYVPGIGAFLSFEIPGFTPPDELAECTDWGTFIQDALTRVGDLLFESLSPGEQLIIAADVLAYREGARYFGISQEMVTPEEWEVTRVGGW